MRAIVILLVLGLGGGGWFLYHSQQKANQRLTEQIEIQHKHHEAQLAYAEKQRVFLNDLFRQVKQSDQKRINDVDELRRTLSQLGSFLSQHVASQVKHDPPTEEEKVKAHEEAQTQAKEVQSEIQEKTDSLAVKGQGLLNRSKEIGRALGEDHPLVKKADEAATRIQRQVDTYGSLGKEIVAGKDSLEALIGAQQEIDKQIQASKDRQQQLLDRRATLRTERNGLLARQSLTAEDRQRLQEIEEELGLIEEELQAEEDSQFVLNLLKTLTNLFMVAQCLMGNPVACFAVLFSMGGGDGDGDKDGKGKYEGMYPPGPPPAPPAITGESPVPQRGPQTPPSVVNGTRPDGAYTLRTRPGFGGGTEIIIRHGATGSEETYFTITDPNVLNRLKSAQADSVMGFGGPGPKAIILIDPNGARWSLESMGEGNPPRVNESVSP